MLCWSRVVPFFILIVLFLWQILSYITNRKKLKEYSHLLRGDDRWDERNIKLNRWLIERINQENEKKKLFETRADDDNNNNNNTSKEEEEEEEEEMLSAARCRELALLVPPPKKNHHAFSSSDDDDDICAKMTRDVCGIDSQFIEKITIPDGEKTSFIAANGLHLLSGETYCVFKKPPLSSYSSSSSSSLSVKCNQTWGYWKYSPIQDRWVCHSKVPGIYDAEKDQFTPCSAGGGKFVIDNVQVSPEQLATEYEPRDFYDVEFQKRCGCACDEKMGYVFVPEKSRTTCFKDPCRAALPPFSAAPGYVSETGNCDCGRYFTNLFHDAKQPCTACPFDRPQYDEKEGVLTVFIKCGNKDDEYDDYLFPCESDEDKLRGCRKAVVRVKPIMRNLLDEKNNRETFEDRMFW